MIRNWFLTAIRSFRKNKTASAINIFGLTVGLSSCLLIALYIRHELSYDDFEQKGGRIARLIMEYRFDGGGETQRGNYTSTKVAPTFKRVFPEVESAVRMTDRDRIVGYGDKLFTEDVMFADSSFFDVFSFGLLKGDAATALSGPRKMVLTETAARRLFGPDEPLGKIVRVGTDSVNYLVTGVMADPPSNSQIKFGLLASFSSMYANQEESYWDANYTTFLLLRAPAGGGNVGAGGGDAGGAGAGSGGDRSAFATLQPKITAFMKKEMRGQGASVNFLLEPFMRIHLHSEYGGFEPNVSITNIYILAGVALLILVIACSTYINLSTARSVERAREVGVRKVIGAGRGQLFWQFIGESLLLCLMAVILSLGVVLLALPAFNHLADRQLGVGALLSPVFLGIALLIAVVVSLLAGGYPALILSGFQPVKVLKGAFKNTRSGQGLRQSLIVFQFVISVFLIVSTLLMQGQLSYIQHKQLGYDRDHVLVLPMTRKMLAEIDYIKTQFRTNPDVLSLSAPEGSPVSIMGGYNMRSSTMPAGEQLAVTADPIDPDFIRTTGIQLVAGEGITEQDMRDTEPKDTLTKPVYHFILNESAARVLGWTPQEAIGKRMFMDESRPGFVKGVVKDFHFQSLHYAIRPLVLFPERRGNMLLVRVTGEHLPQTIAFLERKWKEMIPYLPWDYHFLDEDYNRLYTSELRLGRVMNLFSGIAIVLACLGLFGLSSYAAKQRVKEIGIRKVLGASLPQLAILLSMNFIRLALVAILIAFPLVWWVMRGWLQGFVYRTGMDWRIYGLAGVAVIAIAGLTVSIQAVKTALLNPVKNLKVE